jgi:hypothetical protein
MFPELARRNSPTHCSRAYLELPGQCPLGFASRIALTAGQARAHGCSWRGQERKTRVTRACKHAETALRRLSLPTHSCPGLISSENGRKIPATKGHQMVNKLPLRRGQAGARAGRHGRSDPARPGGVCAFRRPRTHRPGPRVANREELLGRVWPGGPPAAFNPGSRVRTYRLSVFLCPRIKARSPRPVAGGLCGILILISSRRASSRPAG